MQKSILILIAGTLLAGCQLPSNSGITNNQAQHSGATVQGSDMASGDSGRPHLSGTGLLNLISSKKFNLNQNIAYGVDVRQKLDVYTPLNASVKNPPKPVIVFVHGGSWSNGSKDDYPFVGESLTKAGYVTVIINYRLAPQHPYPDYVQDTALAIKWVHGNIVKYQGNPDKIIVMGHSAGAFNAVEAVDNQRWLQEVAVPVQSIKAVVGIAGPYSYDFRTDSTRNAFPTSATPEQVMPVYHIRRDAPPHLLLIGSKDQRVKPQNALAMQQALQQQNVPVQLTTIDGAGHLSIMAAMASRLSWYKDTRQVVLSYLQKTVPD